MPFAKHDAQKKPSHPSHDWNWVLRFISAATERMDSDEPPF